MQLLIKIGDKRRPDDPAYLYDWRDGNIIDVRPDGFYEIGGTESIHHCILDVPVDYWTAVKASNFEALKTPTDSWLAVKKYMTAMVNSYLPWDPLYISPEKFSDYRMRDWFVDFKSLLLAGLISQKQYDSVYNKKIPHEKIYIDRDFTTLIKSEVSDTRLEKSADEILAAVGTIDAGGIYTIGTSQTYASWSAAIADLPADIGAMTTPGDITLRGNTDEEITESTVMTLSLDTDVYTLTLDIADGVKHNGGAYGNGHRIALTTADGFLIDEAIDGTLNKLIISDLAIDAAGSSNFGIRNADSGSTADGAHVYRRNVIKGDASSYYGLYLIYNYPRGTFAVQNNVIYGFANANTSYGYGIYSHENYAAATQYRYFLNNTCCKNRIGIGNISDDADMITHWRNNLCVGNETADFEYPTAEPNTTEKNVSGDTTSPDGATYQTWAGTANMVDYANNDFRLDGADTTLDDGDDLSAIGAPAQFSDDIQGQTRATWYIGASEYVAAGGGGTISVDSGTFEITGINTSLLKNSIIPSNSGVFSISGLAANLLYGRSLTSDVGNLVVSGQDVALTYSTGLNIIAESGFFAISCGSANLLRHLIMPIDYGEFSITGQNSGLFFNRHISSVSGSFSIAGQNLDLSYHRIMPLEIGSISIQGQDSALLFNRFISSDAGSLSITGQASSLLLNLLLSASTGSILIIGSDVILDYSGFVLPNGVMSITFSSKQPSITFS